MITSLRGSCACSQITYTSSVLPLNICHCHCTTCRKHSGAVFSTFASIPNTALTWTIRPPAAVKLVPSAIAVRGFCDSCGSPLFMKYHCRPEVTHVTMGTVDEGSVAGDLGGGYEHVFWNERAGWWRKDDGSGTKWGEFDDWYKKCLEQWEQGARVKRDDV